MLQKPPLPRLSPPPTLMSTPIVPLLPPLPLASLLYDEGKRSETDLASEEERKK